MVVVVFLIIVMSMLAFGGVVALIAKRRTGVAAGPNNISKEEMVPPIRQGKEY